MNVRHRFLLEFAPLRFRRKVVDKRAINVSRMCIMPFDEVGVIAIHRTNQIANRVAENRVDTTGKLICLGNQGDDFVLQRI